MKLENIKSKYPPNYSSSKRCFRKILAITITFISTSLVIGLENIAQAENINTAAIATDGEKLPSQIPIQSNSRNAQDLKLSASTPETFTSITDADNLNEIYFSDAINFDLHNRSNPEIIAQSQIEQPSKPAANSDANNLQTTPPPASENQPDYTPAKTTPPPEANTPVNSTPPVSSGLTIDKVQTDFSYQSDNYNLEIYSVEPSIQFRLGNNQKINLKSGFTTLSGQPRVKSVTIYPVRLGWEGYFPKFSLRAGTTLNNFNRLPSALGFDAGLTVPVLPNMFIGATVERTPMKYAPSVLETPEKTTFTSYGPNLYWQIDSKTTLTSFFNFLQYNDGNRSQLSYTKLKRSLGNFSVAANLVTSSFERDASFTSGYYSPADFLLYNGEIGWQGDITKELNFRVQFNLGEQRSQGEFSNALYTEAQLTAKVNPKLNAFIKYSYGELDQITYYRNIGVNQDNLYNQSLLTGQVQYTF